MLGTKINNAIQFEDKHSQQWFLWI